MNVYQATSELLCKANYYAIRPDGRNFRLNPTSYAIRADRPANHYLNFRATDLLADDWEIRPIPTEQPATESSANGA